MSVRNFNYVCIGVEVTIYISVSLLIIPGTVSLFTDEMSSQSIELFPS